MQTENRLSVEFLIFCGDEGGDIKAYLNRIKAYLPRTSNYNSLIKPLIKYVRNIPNFKDGCDLMELLFSRKMAYRLPKRPQSPFRGFQAYFEEFS